MALIKCPECGREISDRGRACPQCGYPLDEFHASETVQKVEVTSVKMKPVPKHKKKKACIIGGCVLGAVILIVGGIFVANSIKDNSNYADASFLYESGSYKEAEAAFLSLGDYKDSAAKADQCRIKSKNSYIDRVNSTMYLMLDGASDAETMCNLTAKVWYNCIHEEHDTETDKYTLSTRYNFHDDFNTALGLLFADDEIKNDISDIDQNQADVQTMLKELKNPEAEFEDCYSTLNDLYIEYKGITDLAINPTGSYNTFASGKNEKISAFLEIYAKLEAQIPDKEDVEPPIIGDNDYFRMTRWGMTKEEVQKIEKDIEALSSEKENELNYLITDNYALEGVDTLVTYIFDETTGALKSVLMLLGDDDASKSKIMMLVAKYEERFGQSEPMDYLGGSWKTVHSEISIAFMIDGLAFITYSDINTSEEKPNA